MSEQKLSKTQRELLEALKAGVAVHYMPYSGWFNPHAYWFRGDNYARVTAASEALLKKGLAVRDNKSGRTLLKVKA